MNFITSDLHFWHSNILKYNQEKRPFECVEDMNKHLINSINETCSEDDTLYSLGDFSFGSEAKAREILEQINCKIAFVLGNHCRHRRKLYEQYGEVYDYLEIKHNGHKVVLFHYPISVWNGSHYGSIQLYGHCHGSYQGNGRQMDVGWDAHGRILTLEEAVNMCLDKEVVFMDGHTGERK